MDEESIKKENYPKSVKSEMRVEIKDEPGPLWEGEVRFKTQEKSKEIKFYYHGAASQKACIHFLSHLCGKS